MAVGVGRHTLVEWLVVAVVATVGVTLATFDDSVVRVDAIVYDALALALALALARAASRPAPDSIVIVAIDDISVAALGRWPWPRAYHTALLHQLAAARPRAIGYDVLFTEQSADPTVDDALAVAVADARPVVPLLIESPGRDGAAATVIDPIAGVRAGAAGIGHVDLTPDADGVVRRFLLTDGPPDHRVPHFAALLACRAAHVLCAPLPSSGPVLIDFGGPPPRYRTIPFVAVMRGEVPAAVLRDRIVLIGATATGVGDVYATPVSRAALTPGVALNAAIVETLVRGGEIAPAGLAARLALAFIAVGTLLLTLLLTRPRTHLVVTVGIALATVALSIVTLRTLHIWLPPATSVLALALIFPVWSWRRLAATHSYIRAELKRFRHDRDDIPTRRRLDDVIGDDRDHLAAAIARVRDLRAFVTDTLNGLPDATLVIGGDDRVQIANAPARHLLPFDAVGIDWRLVLARLSGAHPDGIDPAMGADGSDMVGPGDRVFNLCWSDITDSAGVPVCQVLRLADITALRAATVAREQALQLLTHDMRTPQAAILATLAQVKATIEPAVSRRIEGYARQTLDLADGFVQLARAKAQPLTHDDLDLSDLLIDAVDSLWPLS
jgi:CHASE2 domain-containing sensor protein